MITAAVAAVVVAVAGWCVLSMPSPVRMGVRREQEAES